jgi:hypothetical protein
MASSFIVTRETKSGARRFVVRYRLGGRLACPARRLVLDHEGGARAAT